MDNPILLVLVAAGILYFGAKRRNLNIAVVGGVFLLATLTAQVPGLPGALTNFLSAILAAFGNLFQDVT